MGKTYKDRPPKFGGTGTKNYNKMCNRTCNYCYPNKYLYEPQITKHEKEEGLIDYGDNHAAEGD